MAMKRSTLFVSGALVIIYASIVFNSLEAVTTAKDQRKEETAYHESQGRVLLLGGLVRLLPQIYKIYNVYDKVNNVYQTVNWTFTQAFEHIDKQCFPYCQVMVPSKPCECNVSNPNEPPQVTPNDQQCKSFQQHCCKLTIFGLKCEQCCKGSRSAILTEILAEMLAATPAPAPAPALA